MTKLHNRGFFGIGIWGPMYEENVGGLYRSAVAFGASFLFSVGRKYKRQSTDTCNSIRHVPYYNYLTGDELIESLPSGCRIVCVEIADNARDLTTFCHPECAVYVLGNETMGIPPKFMYGKLVVKIPTVNCLNVASAGTVVMYDRVSKMKNCLLPQKEKLPEKDLYLCKRCDRTDPHFHREVQDVSPNYEIKPLSR